MPIAKRLVHPESLGCTGPMDSACQDELFQRTLRNSRVIALINMELDNPSPAQITQAPQTPDSDNMDDTVEGVRERSSRYVRKGERVQKSL